MDDLDMPVWEVRAQTERFKFGWSDPSMTFGVIGVSGGVSGGSGGVSMNVPSITKAPPKHYVLKSPSYSEWPPALNPTIIARDLTYFEAEAMCKLLNAGVEDG